MSTDAAVAAAVEAMDDDSMEIVQEERPLSRTLEGQLVAAAASKGHACNISRPG